MIRIVARRMARGGHAHEHIIAVRWTQLNGTVPTDSTVGDVVEWLDESGRNRAVVGNYPHDHADVRTVHPIGGRPHLRTVANDEWTDNLLALPEY